MAISPMLLTWMVTRSPASCVMMLQNGSSKGTHKEKQEGNTERDDSQEDDGYDDGRNGRHPDDLDRDRDGGEGEDEGDDDEDDDEERQNGHTRPARDEEGRGDYEEEDD